MSSRTCGAASFCCRGRARGRTPRRPRPRRCVIGRPARTGRSRRRAAPRAATAPIGRDPGRLPLVRLRRRVGEAAHEVAQHDEGAGRRPAGYLDPVEAARPARLSELAGESADVAGADAQAGPPAAGAPTSLARPGDLPLVDPRDGYSRAQPAAAEPLRSTARCLPRGLRRRARSPLDPGRGRASLPPMTKRVAFYAGVSTRTGGQTVEKQLRDLRAGADRLGRAVVATITNEGASGAKGRDRRPGSDVLLRAVTRRGRAGRRRGPCAGWVAASRTSSASGRGRGARARGLPPRPGPGQHDARRPHALPDARDLFRVQRVRAGLARPQGRRCGRPPVDRAREKKGRELLGRGLGIVKVAKAACVGVSVVYRAKVEVAASAPA